MTLLSVAEPVLRIATVWLGGVGWAGVELKVSAAGSSASVGPATVKVTVSVSGPLVLLAAETWYDAR